MKKPGAEAAIGLMLFDRDPKNYINMKILHSDSKDQDKGNSGLRVL